MRFKTPKLNKRIKILFPVLVVLAFSFIFANPAQANWASDVVGGIISLIISALGLILILVIKGLLIIASYQEFIGSPAVTQGWVIVRDFSNMFFVVVLLVIAFATILHIEEYNYKKWLPKLILMAVLINFSKTICGLLIDVAQIVMLTFVNAFKDIAGGNFIEMLGIKEIVTLSKANPEMSEWTVIGAYVLGLIYMIIALVVITTMMMILAMRLVMIWIYVVLSPLAYLLSAFPGGAKYASKWWQDFISNLIVGPVLAFFIWLSFAALQTGSNAIITNSATESISSEAQQTIGYEKPVAASEASTPGALIKFVIGIGMLIGGLKIAQEIGGVAGSIAGKGVGKINSMTSSALNYGKRSLINTATNTAKWTGRQALGAGSLALKKTGDVFGSNTMKTFGSAGLSWRKDLIKNRKDEKTKKRKQFLEKIGIGENTADIIHQNFKGEDKQNRNNQTTANVLGLGGTGAAIGATAGPLGAAIGGAIGLSLAGIFRLAANKKDKDVDQAKNNLNSAEQDLAQKQNNYQQALSLANGNINDPNVVSAKTALDQSEIKVNTAKKDLRTKEGKEDSFKSFLYSAAENMGSFSTKYTSEAAKKIAEVSKNARSQVTSMANDTTWMSNASASGFYSSNGQTESQAALIKKLSDDSNPDALQARNNLIDWVNNTNGNGYDANNPKDVNVLRSLAKGIAASDKKGEVDISKLSDLINAINNRSNTIGGDVNSFKSGVIAYRQSGESSLNGDKMLRVDAFANGKNDKNVIAVDFEELNKKGFEIDKNSDGAFVGTDNFEPLKNALLQIIKQEKDSLSKKYSDGSITDNDYQNQLKDLDKAEDRLNNDDVGAGLAMVNSGSKNFARKARLTTVYHEQIHQGGLEDEDLTESIANSLMDKKLYGRNSETGGRHAQELAQLAKSLQDQGNSKDDILKSINQEIDNRLNKEGKSRASRVLKMEKGEMETETDFINSQDKDNNTENNKKSDINQEVSLDSSSLDKTIKELTAAFSKNSQNNQDLDFNSSINKLITLTRAGNYRMIKKLSQIKADKINTPLELDAVIENIK